MHAFIEEQPASEKLLAKARALAPGIAARRVAADNARDVPAQTVRELQAAGLFRGFQPREYGGLELDPRLVLDIQNILAEACPSTGWIYGVLSVQAFVLARFPARAQADVWGANPDALVSSSFVPLGKVTLVEGGYRLSGRWTFSSGSTHSSWALIGGLVPSANPGGPPQRKVFLLPRADYTVVDSWQVLGLRATGSNDIDVEDVFVPEYRSYAPDAGLLPLADTALPELYRLPWLYVFTSTISNLGIGMARGMLKAFTAIAQARTPGPAGPGGPTAQDLQAIARTHAEIDALELLEKRNFGRLIAAVQTGETLDLSEALLYRSQLTSLMRRIAALADELMLLAGSKGIRQDSLLGRFWLDFGAARAHMGNDPTATFAQFSGALMTVA